MNIFISTLSVLIIIIVFLLVVAFLTNPQSDLSQVVTAAAAVAALVATLASTYLSVRAQKERDERMDRALAERDERISLQHARGRAQTYLNKLSKAVENGSLSQDLEEIEHELSEMLVKLSGNHRRNLEQIIQDGYNIRCLLIHHDQTKGSTNTSVTFQEKLRQLRAVFERLGRDS